MSKGMFWRFVVGGPAGRAPGREGARVPVEGSKTRRLRRVPPLKPGGSGPSAGRPGKHVRGKGPPGPFKPKGGKGR